MANHKDFSRRTLKDPLCSLQLVAREPCTLTAPDGFFRPPTLFANASREMGAYGMTVAIRRVPTPHSPSAHADSPVNSGYPSKTQGFHPLGVYPPRKLHPACGGSARAVSCWFRPSLPQQIRRTHQKPPPYHSDSMSGPPRSIGCHPDAMGSPPRASGGTTCNPGAVVGHTTGCTRQLTAAYECALNTSRRPERTPSTALPCHHHNWQD